MTRKENIDLLVTIVIREKTRTLLVTILKRKENGDLLVTIVTKKETRTLLVTIVTRKAFLKRNILFTTKSILIMNKRF